jgi:hypothetical protein
VKTQLGNCSGRMHLPGRHISDPELLYVIRSMPVAGLGTALVTRLVLDGNSITSVEQLPWPPSLTHISLRHNLLTSVASARWPPQLRCLHLDSNAIQHASAPPAAPPTPSSSSSSSSSSAAAAAAVVPRSHALASQWPLHLTVLDLGRNKLSAPACAHRPCCVTRSSNAPSHSHVRCLDALQQLLPCSALEQVCLYNNAFDKLQLHTALLARGYPQPPVQRLQDDMNALPLIRSVVWGLCCGGVVLRGGCAATAERAGP